MSDLLPGIARLPQLPAAVPLDWQRAAAAFDRCIMDPATRVAYRDPQGAPAFTAFLEGEQFGTARHELVSFGPIVLGKLLAGDDVAALAPGVTRFFNPRWSIFLNTPGDSRCEMWYLMYANALAGHLVRRWAPAGEAAALWRRSAASLRRMARRLNYDFDHQGYDFAAGEPWTAADIYRQPDAVGGYAYLMLLAHEWFGEAGFLNEAQAALGRYLAFPHNPWYEVPSGALAALAAARLNAVHGGSYDLATALRRLFDPAAALVVGNYGACEVNGLMRGWRHSAPESAYSMESLMVLPFVLPLARYAPRFAADLGRYALNVAANARLFFSPAVDGAESRPDLAAAVPYERLLHEHGGRSPYACGDFQGHKSVYGGAYTLWWGALVQPSGDPYLLRLDLAATDFLDGDAPAAYLYYNPHGEPRRVAEPLPPSGALVDLVSGRTPTAGEAGAASMDLPAGGACVLAAAGVQSAIGRPPPRA